MCMTLTPSSLKPEVGIRARTPREVTTLWSEDGSEFESELVDDDLEEEGLSGDGEDGSGQEGGEREGERVRRGVVLRRKRVVMKVTRMRKRVRRRCGVMCMKPYQRWGVRTTTRLIYAQGLKRHAPLHHHHQGRQCGHRVCSVSLYLHE